jgi:hypothetical protein
VKFRQPGDTAALGMDYQLSGKLAFVTAGAHGIFSAKLCFHVPTSAKLSCRASADRTSRRRKIKRLPLHPLAKVWFQRGKTMIQATRWHGSRA